MTHVANAYVAMIVLWAIYAYRQLLLLWCVVLCCVAIDDRW